MLKYLTGTRKRVYAQAILAVIGVLEVVNPSRIPIWDAIKEIATIFGA